MKDKISVIWKALIWAVLLTVFPVLSGVIATIKELQVPYIMLLQGAFMVFPVLLVGLLILRKVFTLQELKLTHASGIQGNVAKIRLSLLIFLVYVPHMLRGFEWKGTEFFFATMFLYLFVGIAEELFFRGIIPVVLGRAFGESGVIFWSTVLFALAHAASALSGTSPLIILLTIVNAALFGWMAMEFRRLYGNIIPLMAIHFLFDFESKFSRLSGTELVAAEGIRGCLLLGLALVFQAACICSRHGKRHLL